MDMFWTSSSGLVTMGRLEKILRHSLEIEMRAVTVFETVMLCAPGREHREEWKQRLEDARDHVHFIRELMSGLGLDPDAEGVVKGPAVLRTRLLGDIVKAALVSGDREAADRIAAEYVSTEANDSENWTRVCELAEKLAAVSRQGDQPLTELPAAVAG
jgi:hypothetical protein